MGSASATRFILRPRMLFFIVLLMVVRVGRAEEVLLLRFSIQVGCGMGSSPVGGLYGVRHRSNVVHRVGVVVRADLVAELNVFIEAVLDERDCVIDAHRLGELAVRFQIARLVRRVLENDVGL